LLDKLNENQRRYNFLNKNHPELIQELEFFLNKNNLIFNNFSQKLWHFKNNKINVPKCYCGNKLKFINFNRGYRLFCSKKCSMNDDDILKKRNEKSKQTCLNKYGVDNPMKSEIIKEKIIKNNIDKYNKKWYFQTDEFKEKVIKNNIDKYNKKWYFQTDEFKDKSKNTIKNKYNVDHISKNENIKKKNKQTCLNKYGVNNPMKSEIIKEKIINNNLNKIGYKHHMIYKKENKLLKYFFNKQSYNYYNEKINNNYKLINIIDNNLIIKCKRCCKNFKIQKQLFYLRNKKNIEICTNCNPTYCKNISQLEIELQNYIKSIYNKEILFNNKIIYPYEIDIYLPKLNIGFEFNGLYWHGELNKTKDYHINKLSICENKNIKLFYIWEDEWIHNKEKIKNLIFYNICEKSIINIKIEKDKIIGIRNNNIVSILYFKDNELYYKNYDNINNFNLLFEHYKKIKSNKNKNIILKTKRDFPINLDYNILKIFYNYYFVDNSKKIKYDKIFDNFDYKLYDGGIACYEL